MTLAWWLRRGSIPRQGATDPHGIGRKDNMSKVYGVKCDRCGEVLSASSASKLASLFDEWGWECRTVGRVRMDWCEPCQGLNDEMRRAIVEKLQQV